MRIICLIVCFITFSLSGCSTLNRQAPELLARAEEQCAEHDNKTLCKDVYLSHFNGLISGQPHPRARKKEQTVNLQSEGYIISFDKSKQAKFAAKFDTCNPPNQKSIFGDLPTSSSDFTGCVIRQSSVGPNLSDVGLIDFTQTHDYQSATYRDRVRKTLKTQSKNIFVTSVISYSGPENTSKNVFSLTQHDCSNAWTTNRPNDQVFIDCSFTAFDNFESELNRKLASGDFTHVILMSSGWNTVPSDSVRNYNDLLSNIGKLPGANKDEFRPLVIGLTWPSRWLGTRLFSYSGKGNDADEIGLTWGNYLMNKTIPDALKDSGNANIKTVVIGHSFGARLLSTAAVSDDLLTTRNMGNSADVMFLMQSAFSARRFHDQRGAGHKQFLSNLESKVDVAALTASSGDWLVRIALHVDGMRGHVSSGAAWSNICEDSSTDEGWRDKFDCQLESEFNQEIRSQTDKILYIKMDKSNIGHGGVWGKPTAKIIWDLIK